MEPSTTTDVSKLIWRYKVMGEIRGPVDHVELTDLVERNEINRDTFVSNDGENWMTADHVEDLFDSTSAADDRVSDLYYQVMGEVRGPITTSAWKRLAATRNDIGRDTLVRRGGGEWISADRLDGQLFV